MTRRFTRILAAVALLVFMTPSLVALGQTRTETLVYTLSITKNTSNTGYANYYDITVNSKDWKAPGNQSLGDYIKIGGKPSSDDRYLYSKTAISNNVSKIEVTHGDKDSQITVNSMTLYVYSTATDAANNTNPIATISGTFVANGTTTFEKQNSDSWSNCFYRINYNLTSSSTSKNYGFIFTDAKFYEVTGGGDTPSISASNVEIAYDATGGSISYTINNPANDGVLTASTTATWLTIGNVGTTVPFTCSANENTTERTATVTLTYTYDTDQTVTKYVTVTQAQYVADYATLPFAFDGGRADIATTNGLTQEGLDSDYGSSPKLKFNGTDDYVLLKFNERPGTLTFDIKGNTFSGGTFTVQTSEDGETYTDLETYTELGDTQHESFANLGENVRYIKWVYTEKVSGNVGLGNIALAKYVAPPASITLNSYSIEATAVGTEGTLTVTYTEIETEMGADIYWFESDGVTSASEPDWMTADINSELNVEYLIEENEGAARTAYFKVYGVDEEDNDVYSNLVTVSQAAAPQQYTLEVTSISNAEIYVFDATDPDETNWVSLFEGVGSEQVTEGTTIALSVTAEVGYTLSSLMVNGVNHVADISGGVYTFTMPSDNVTISATAVEDVPVTPGTWVLTSLAELTEDDIFVIVGTDNDIETSYALPNDKGTSTPDAVVVYVVDNTLSGEPDARLQWNISGNATNGYTFYPNGSTETWLYCTASNDGVRVGTNSNKTFTFVDGSNNSYTNQAHYLFNTATSRYVGVYTTNPDWRCYTSVNNNICNQSFAFYKKVVEPATETYTLDIAQYTSKENGWYLIASPVSVDLTTNDMVSGTYDLYRFNPTAELEWENYKATENNEPLHTDFTTLEVGRGYLYANGNDGGIQLSFTGVPSNNGQVNMPYAGWNLVGNPLSTAATITNDYYRMNDTHTGIMTEAGTGNIALMEGVFVQAAEAGQTVTFTPAQSGNNNGKSAVEINLSQNRGGVIDRAIVRFGNSNTLPKLQLFENSTKIYIAQDGEDYAIVNAEAQGELPVSFRANENGQYTLTVNPEGVEMNYLHLIDNMTGADINLLQTPSYTFNATTRDYESRFRLVFAANNKDGVSTGSTAFAFYSNGNWIINNAGEATLQVIDVTGRVLSSETVSGSVSKTINATPGVYMLRLINGENVNVQKIVVR